MRRGPAGGEQFRVTAVLPARDEEASLGGVLEGLDRLGSGVIEDVVVVDNGSRDRTAAVARECGASVVEEPRPGYGSACLAGIAHLAARSAGSEPAVVVFVDADGSSAPGDLPRLLAPIRDGAADFVVGSRVRGQVEPGAWPPHARWGSRFAAFVLRLRTGYRFTDLGPFRAIRWETLSALGMSDPDYGWTAEMQLRAAAAGVPTAEVPVSCRRRAVGRSKVSGTLTGSFLAGVKILLTVFHPGLSGTPAASVQDRRETP